MEVFAYWKAKKPELYALCKILCSKSDEWFNQLEEEVELYHAVYQNTDYDDLKWRRLKSALLKQVYHFLSHDQFNKTESKKRIFLIQSLLDLELDKHSRLELLNYEKGRTSEESFTEYFNHYRASILNLSYNERYGDRFNLEPLTDAFDKLEQFYVFEKLKLICARFSFRQIGADREFYQQLVQFVNNLKKEDLENDKAVYTYYVAANLLIQEEKESWFNTLKQLLEKHFNIFAEGEIRDLSLMAINYCVRCINAGNLEFLFTLFELYDFSIKNKSLFQNGELSPWTFKNFISCGLRIEKYDEIETFINEYSNFLPEEEKENAITYNMAKLHFSKGDFYKVLRLLQYVEYTDIFYNLDAKTLLLKTFYELDEQEVMSSLLNSFQKLLQRKKNLSANRLKNYKNFLRLFKKLSRSAYRKKELRLQLKDEIVSTKNVADKNWLIQKINEIL